MKDLYTRLTKAAREHLYLHHYATIEALESILENRSIRLSKLDKVNDKVENGRIDSIWNNRIYVACFTHDNKENETFWGEYAKKDRGVKITFKNLFKDIEIFGDAECKEFKLPLIERSDVTYDKYGEVSDWGYKDITLADIEYVKDINKYREFHEELYKEFKDCININMSNYYECAYEGLIKTLKWKIESETRIRVAVKPIGFEYARNNGRFIHIKPNFDYIYMKLNNEILENISITVNPWATTEFKERVKNIINNCNLGQLIKLNY